MVSEKKTIGLSADTSTVVSPNRGKGEERMAEYSKYTDADRINAIELMASGISLNQVSRKLGIPKGTLSGWRNGCTKETEQYANTFEQLRTHKKEEFIERSWRIIGKAQELLEDKLDADKALIEKERKLKTTELTNAIGIQYDKQALANNESTVNTNEKIEIVFSIPRPPKK